jgi:hypothetical protein
MKYFLLVFVVFISGCLSNPFREQGAVVMDTMVHEAEMIICNDASVGSIKRKYGSSKAMAEKWRSFCETVNVPILDETD